MIQSSNKLIVKDSFEMPAVDDTTLLVLRECANLVPHCWIWNESVGYLEVTDYKGFDIEITVKNIGRIENAKEGTVFPSCMEFIITAPDSLPMYDTTVTCLTADFRSPEVGETAMMVVEDTSNIRVDDILIIDRKYRYTVTEILDEHTLVVLNEGDGKEGIIDVRCNECISVKILESTACCKVVREDLQAEIDDINDRLNNKKDIKAWNGNNLVTISGGDDALTDAQFDATIKVDNDLSKYDNSVSQFITDADIPRGNLTVTSTDNVMTINSGSGTNALLKNANINLNLSNYAKKSELPVVNNGTLTIQQNGTTIATFTANTSNNSVANITVPSVPTVPTQYSGFTNGQMLSEYDKPLNSGSGYVLSNSATSGAPKDDEQSLDSEFPTITIASPSTSGHNIIIVGSIFFICEGWFHTDTHTYPDSGYNSLVTARGPITEFFVKPIINSNGTDHALYNNYITSGKAFHLVLDTLPNQTADNTAFSQQLTVPIVYEINPNTTNTIKFTGKFWADGLRDAGGSSSNPSTFYNENVRVKILRLKSYIALGWVIK